MLDARLIQNYNQDDGLLGPVYKQLSLCQVLCKTYKRDTIFAGSMTNVLQKIEDELGKLQYTVQKSDEKKRHYKHVARQFHQDFQNQLAKERKEFEEKSAQMTEVINEQQELIESLN